MNKKIFYAKGQERIGPITLDELKRLNLVAETLIWQEGWDEWKKINQDRGIFHFLYGCFPEELKTITPPPLPHIITPPPIPKEITGINREVKVSQKQSMWDPWGDSKDGSITNSFQAMKLVSWILSIVFAIWFIVNWIHIQDIQNRMGAPSPPPIFILGSLIGCSVIPAISWTITYFIGKQQK